MSYSDLQHYVRDGSSELQNIEIPLYCIDSIG